MRCLTCTSGLAIVFILSWAQTSAANPTYSASANIVDFGVTHYGESQFGSPAPVSFMGTHNGSSASASSAGAVVTAVGNADAPDPILLFARGLAYYDQLFEDFVPTYFTNISVTADYTINPSPPSPLTPARLESNFLSVHLLGVGVLRSHRVEAQSNRYLTIDIHVAELPRSYVERTT